MNEGDRCGWCKSDPLYVRYHDEEWGVPERDPVALFERLTLEGMQAGLSWWTVLQKRAHMRERFFEFDPEKLARFGARRMNNWLNDAGLIRHRGKLEAMVSNARLYLEEEDFSALIWGAVEGEPLVNRWQRLSDVPAHTLAAQRLAKQMKKAGYRFVGPTTIYAFMQSAGLVNDHLVTCPWHQRCVELGDA